MEIQDIYSRFLECSGLTTDSRKCGPGLMFLALRGERFDGNEYAKAALEQGCRYAVIDNVEYHDASDSRIILVDNSLKTLQQLAAHHRRVLGIPVIGITGTNGKTTTKELCNAVMSSTFRTLCTAGNLNNSIGVPLTVLGMDRSHEYAIIEMGASHPGDIDELVRVSQPDCGLITNVGMAHLLGFGSFEGVKKTKGELYDWLRGHGGFAFLNRADADLAGMAQGLPSIGYGQTCSDGQAGDLSVEGRLLGCNPYLEFEWRSRNGAWHAVKTSLIGAYNLNNALAAICVGLHFGVSEAAASKAIGEYVPSNNRSQLTVTERNRLVVDAYNANPSSMRAALENFKLMEADGKVLILGDMRELGDSSAQAHRDILSMVLSGGFESVFLVGGEFASAFRAMGSPAGNVKLFENVEQLQEMLEANPVEGKTVLVKGSNSTRLTTLLPLL